MPFVLGDGTIMFGDGRINIDIDGRVSASLGGGFRTTVPGDVVLGANLFADFTATEYGNTYQQLSAGLEALAGAWEFRLNGYVPLGDTENEEASLSTAELSGGTFRIHRGYEVALHGIDAEVGVLLPVFEDDAAVLKLLAGAYALDSRLTGPVQGLSLRAELSFDLGDTLPGGNVTFGAGLSHDTLDGTGGNVFVRLSAPIGGEASGSKSKDSPLFQRVERFGGVHVRSGDFGAAEAAFSGGNGNLKVLQLSEADGDTGTLNDLIEAAGEGAIILVSGDVDVDASLVLLANQMLVGGGGIVDLTTADGQHVAYTNPGAATTIYGSGIAPFSGFSLFSAPVEPDVITLADGVVVSTLAIVGGRDGIVGEGISNVRIENVDISGVSANGIRLAGATNVRIADTSIHDLYICESSTDCEYSIFEPSYVPHAAINVVGVDGLTLSNLDIANVTYGVFAAPAIDFDDDWEPVALVGATNIAMSDISITNSRREGILLVGASDVAIDGLVIDNSALERDMDLVVFQTSSNITLNDARFDGGTNALMFAYYSGIPGGRPTNIDVSNVTIDNPSRAGVFMNSVEDVSFTNVTVSNAGSYGVYFYGDSYGFLGGPIQDVRFDGFHIESAADGGIYVAGPIEDIDGAITYDGGSDPCAADLGPWTGTSITQNGGAVLSVNGTVIDDATLADICRAE